MSQTLELTSCANEWWHVKNGDGEHIEYVNHVKIAGCEIELDYGNQTITVTCSDWSIVRDLYPALLIESAEWYNEPDGGNE